MNPNAATQRQLKPLEPAVAMAGMGQTLRSSGSFTTSALSSFAEMPTRRAALSLAPSCFHTPKDAAPCLSCRS